jgi:AcrR family transcriptional regulator
VGRPRTPLLSRDAIALAALRIVDRTGEFTIAQVADALGVRPSSLYNHLSNKAEIIEAMRSYVFREGAFEGGDPEGWDQAVRTSLRRYRECFARHPRLIPLATAYTVSSPEVMGMYDGTAARRHHAVRQRRHRCRLRPRRARRGLGRGPGPQPRADRGDPAGRLRTRACRPSVRARAGRRHRGHRNDGRTWSVTSLTRQTPLLGRR